MKTEKLSRDTVKKVLSRSEMKKIMAGSGGGACGGNQCAGGGGCLPFCVCFNGTCTI